MEVELSKKKRKIEDLKLMEKA